MLDDDGRFFHQLSKIEQIEYLVGWLQKFSQSEGEFDRNERQSTFMWSHVFQVSLVGAVAVLYAVIYGAVFAALGMGDQQFVRVTVIGMISLGVGAVVLAALADLFESMANDARRRRWVRILDRLTENDREQRQ